MTQILCQEYLQARVYNFRKFHEDWEGFQRSLPSCSWGLPCFCEGRSRKPLSAEVFRNWKHCREIKIQCYSSGKDLIFLIYEICTFSIPYYLFILHTGLLKSEALLIVNLIGENWVVAVRKVNPHTAVLIFIRLNYSNNTVLSTDNDFILINTANINAGVRSFLHYFIIISLLSH